MSIKGIDRPFGGGVKSRLIWSQLINWRLGNFFSSHFKWISSQDQQKTKRCCLIIYKVTLTGQSHLMRIFLLRKVTLRRYAITPTPYNECTQLVQKILWFNWMKVTLRSRQTAYIHSTELVWPRTFIIRSWCNPIEWLYGVGVYCTVLYCTVWPCKLTLRSQKIA